MSRIAIVSDSHDNIWHLDSALEQIRGSGAETLLHCGDLCAPFIIHHLAKGFPGEIHIIFGNNDADGRLITQNADGYEGRVTLHGIYAELTLGDRVVAMIHYPEPARRIAESGKVHLTCYGHDHNKHLERIGDNWLLNPGELMGMKGAPTWALYDTETHTVVSFEVPLPNPPSST